MRTFQMFSDKGLVTSRKLRQIKTLPLQIHIFYSSKKYLIYLSQTNKHVLIEGIGQGKGDTLKGESESSQKGECLLCTLLLLVAQRHFQIVPPWSPS